MENKILNNKKGKIGVGMIIILIIVFILFAIIMGWTSIAQLTSWSRTAISTIQGWIGGVTA